MTARPRQQCANAAPSSGRPRRRRVNFVPQWPKIIKNKHAVMKWDSSAGSDSQGEAGSRLTGSNENAGDAATFSTD